MNEKYDVKINIDHGDTYLSFTHNGHQWSSTRIDDPLYEIPKIIKVLLNHLTKEIQRTKSR